MIKAWRGERCLLESSSPSSGEWSCSRLSLFQIFMGMSEFLSPFLYRTCSEVTQNIKRCNLAASVSLFLFLPPWAPVWRIIFLAHAELELQEGRCLASSTTAGARGAFACIIFSSARGWTAAEQQLLLPQTGPLLCTLAGVSSARVVFRAVQPPPWRPSVPLVWQFPLSLTFTVLQYILQPLKQWL